MESFTYLGCRIDACGGSEEEILRRIEIARGCMVSLTKNIWRSSITHSLKIRLYNTYVLLVLLYAVYGSEMWDVTVKSGKRLDAFDQWCLRHILQVPFTAHVINQEVRIRSTQPPVTQTIMARHLRRSSATSSVRIQMRTTRGPSTLASTIRRRSGDDLAVVLDKHGCVR